jgi:hypothetical protein
MARGQTQSSDIGSIVSSIFNQCRPTLPVTLLDILHDASRILGQATDYARDFLVFLSGCGGLFGRKEIEVRCKFGQNVRLLSQ